MSNISGPNQCFSIPIPPPSHYKKLLLESQDLASVHLHLLKDFIILSPRFFIIVFIIKVFFEGSVHSIVQSSFCEQQQVSSSRKNDGSPGRKKKSLFQILAHYK